MNRKVATLLACILCIGVLVGAQRQKSRTISASQAKDHIGQTATVCGLVVSATYREQSNGKPTFLNLDRPYPDSIFTIVIWGSERAKFNKPEEYYRGQRVCARGKIESYQAVPQIVAREARQIELDCNCSGDIYNCSDFKTRAEAQRTYDCCIKKVGRDVHKLDGDGDGKVCEQLREQL